MDNDRYPQLVRFFTENPSLYQGRIKYVSGKDMRLKESEWTPYVLFSQQQDLLFVVIEWTPPGGNVIPATVWDPKNWRGASMVQGRRIVRVPMETDEPNNLKRITVEYPDGWTATYVVPGVIAEASLSW